MMERSMSIRIYNNIYIYTYIHTFTHTYIHTYIHIYIYTYTYTYTHTYIHTYITLHYITYIERLNSPLVFRQILNWDIWKITSDALRFLPVVRGRVPEHSHGPVAYGCFGCGGLSKLKPYRGRWCKHDVYDVSFLGFPFSFSLSFQVFPESVEMQLYILYTVYIYIIYI